VRWSFSARRFVSFDGGKRDQDNVWKVPSVAKGEKYTGLIGVRLEPERMKIYIDIKFHALFIAIIVSILSLCATAIADEKYNPNTNQMENVAPNSTWKYNPYTNKWGYSAPNAAPTYNPHQNTWDMAPPNFQLKYNPISQKWETASPDSRLIYNPVNNTWKYVSPDVSPQSNPSNDQRQNRR
jgi:hypothetical protein